MDKETIGEKTVANNIKKKLHHTVLKLHDISMFEITGVDNICPDLSYEDGMHFRVALKGWQSDKLLRQDGSKFCRTHEHVMHNIQVVVNEADIDIELGHTVIDAAAARQELDAYHAAKDYLEAFDKRGQK